MDYRPVAFHSRPGGPRAAAGVATPGAFPPRPMVVPGPFGPAGRAALQRLLGLAVRRSFYPLLTYGAILSLTTQLGDGTVYPIPNEEMVPNSALTYVRTLRPPAHQKLVWGTGTGSRIRNITSGINVTATTSVNGIPTPASYFWNTHLNSPFGDRTVRPNYYLHLNGLVTRSEPLAGSRLWARDVHEYVNASTMPVPALVPETVFPLPLGVPIPTHWSRMGYPLQWFGPRTWRRPVAYPGGDLTIDFYVDKVLVHVISPHPPTPSIQREVKGRKVGTWGYMAAHTAFALWNLATDWRDWIRIVAAYTPGMPKQYRDDPDLALSFFRDHPENVLYADWASISVELFGWAVDEKIGAFIGQVTEKSSKGIGGLIRIREGVSGNYDPLDYTNSIEGPKTPGAYLTSEILAYFKSQDG